MGLKRIQKPVVPMLPFLFGQPIESPALQSGTLRAEGGFATLAEPGAMQSRLAAFALLACLMAGLCWIGERPPQADSLTLGLLGALALFSELAALPVPRRGSLSHGFVWLFALAQMGGAAWAALIAVCALLTRGGVSERGGAEERAASVLSDALPYLSAFLALKLTVGVASYGFPAGWLATVLSLVVFLAMAQAVLSWLYPGTANQERLLAGGRQARLLQFRVSAMLAPTATLLVAHQVWQGLWLLPVMLGIHQFFWERMADLRALQGSAKETREKLKQTTRDVATKEVMLSESRQEKALVERCLKAFARTTGQKATAQAVFELSRERLPCQMFSVFLRGQEEFKPLLFLDGGGRELSLGPSDFKERDLLRRCWQDPSVCSNPERTSWLFPLHDMGALVFSGVYGRPSKEALDLTSLLADQAAFGFRSAALFEDLARTLDGERAARSAAELAQEQLRESQARLVQSSKMAAVGQLAAGLAHELNTPLAAIVLGLQAGKRSIKKEKLDNAVQRIEQCEEAAGKAKVIVDQLLTHSRKSGGKMEQIALGDVVKSTVDFLQQQIVKEGVELSVESASGLMVRGNAGELSQILTNLMLNARDAVLSRPDGPRRVTVRSYGAHGRAVLEVEDTGPGVPLESRDRIFEPFYTEKEVGRGTGLGLYICRELAEQHGAELTLEEKGTPGALFRLSLPITV